MRYSSLTPLNETIIACRRCPRLVEYRETVPPRASFKKQEYWRKPLPGNGDPNAWLFIIGLAPAAHGANRTGRMFTGDETSRFLTEGLYEKGFANIPNSVSKDDGLIFSGCYLTAAVKCAPPQNKPTPQECMNCRPYLESEFALLKNISAILALGKFAFDACISYAKENGVITKGMAFKHGAKYDLSPLPLLYASYHPSQQNTFTGVLTKEMFSSLLQKIINERAG